MYSGRTTNIVWLAALFECFLSYPAAAGMLHKTILTVAMQARKYQHQ
jgi:hypothetical protein